MYSHPSNNKHRGIIIKSHLLNEKSPKRTSSQVKFICIFFFSGLCLAFATRSHNFIIKWGSSSCVAHVLHRPVNQTCLQSPSLFFLIYPQSLQVMVTWPTNSPKTSAGFYIYMLWIFIIRWWTHELLVCY